MFVLVLPSFARSCMAMKLGIAIAARIPMMTTTTINSMSVNPLALRETNLSPPESLAGNTRGRGTCPAPRGCIGFLLTAREADRQVATLATPGDLILLLRRVLIGGDAGNHGARR